MPSSPPRPLRVPSGWRTPPGRLLGFEVVCDNAKSALAKVASPKRRGETRVSSSTRTQYLAQAEVDLSAQHEPSWSPLDEEATQGPSSADEEHVKVDLRPPTPHRLRSFAKCLRSTLSLGRSSTKDTLTPSQPSFIDASKWVPPPSAAEPKPPSVPRKLLNLVSKRPEPRKQQDVPLHLLPYEAYQRALGPPIAVLYGGKTLDELLRQHGRGEPSAASSGFTSSSDDEGSGSDASADQPEGARDGSEGSTCSSADSSVSSGLVLRRVVKVNREPDLTWLDWDTPAGRRRSIEAWLVELGASAAKEGDGNAGSTS